MVRTRTRTPLSIKTAVRQAVEGVEDPEMPPITIGELGMVIGVTVQEGTAMIQVIPTFSGCPATAYIGADIKTAAVAIDGIDTVEVRWRRDIAWEAERITEAGRDKLRQTGIAPPGSGQTLLAIGGVTCPYCRSKNTRADSPFGAAPCRATYSCRDCKTPFDAIKPI